MQKGEGTLRGVRGQRGEEDEGGGEEWKRGAEWGGRDRGRKRGGVGNGGRDIIFVKGHDTSLTSSSNWSYVTSYSSYVTRPCLGRHT